MTAEFLLFYVKTFASMCSGNSPEMLRFICGKFAQHMLAGDHGLRWLLPLIREAPALMESSLGDISLQSASTPSHSCYPPISFLLSYYFLTLFDKQTNLSSGFNMSLSRVLLFKKNY